MLLKDIQTDIAPVYFENYKPENRILLEALTQAGCPETVCVPPSDTLTGELVYALQQVIGRPDNEMQVHFKVGQNYFFEIARLRAFRWLWKHVVILQQRAANLTILCETSTQQFNPDDENSNILRNTTAAMSAVLGGCDILMVNSHDVMKAETVFGKRIARNMQHILQYESYFNEVEDVARGSYYIEYLTYQFAKNVWGKVVKEWP
jgi:hypothetical protein